MKAIVDVKEFEKTLEIVSKINTKHQTLPILQYVLLEVKNKTLTIIATNLEVGIEGKITADIEEDGVVAIPTQTLLQTIHLITEKNITLHTKETTLHINTKTSKTQIKTTQTSDFPTIPRIKGTSYKIKGSSFAQGIKTTATTASQSSIKPELGCVYIHQKKEHSLTFVATDSFRLIEQTISLKNIILQEPILIPYKNALEIAHVVDVPEEIHLSVNENQCAVVVGNIYITSRLVGGSFPDYEQIIPKEFKTTITTLTKDFIQTLKKTSIFLNKFMQLTITTNKNGCSALCSTT